MCSSIASIIDASTGRPKCRSETWRIRTGFIGADPLLPVCPSARLPESRQVSDHGVRELTRGRGAAQVSREHRSSANDRFERTANTVGPEAIADVIKHEAGRQDERAGIGDSLTR